MIPKSSRFKCERCGWLKRKPGKCEWCGKVADFDNLIGGGVESRHAPVSLVSGPAGNARRGTRPDSRISDRPANHFNFSAAVDAQNAINPPGRNWAQKAEPSAGNTLCP